MNMTQTLDTVGQNMREAGRNLWLASLGTAASIEQGSRQLFDRLVARGEARRPEGFTGLSATLQETKTNVTERVKGLGQKAEDRLEEGVSSAMKRLGVPVREDFEILIDRIEQLSRKVDDLAKG